MAPLWWEELSEGGTWWGRVAESGRWKPWWVLQEQGPEVGAGLGSEAATAKGTIPLASLSHARITPLGSRELVV